MEDENRQKVFDTGYLESVERAIKEYKEWAKAISGMRGFDLTMGGLKTVVASLMNLSLGSCGKSSTPL